MVWDQNTFKYLIQLKIFHQSVTDKSRSIYLDAYFFNCYRLINFLFI